MKFVSSVMLSAFMLATVTTALAQNAPTGKPKENGSKGISKFEAGKKLTADDLGFLDLIYNSEGGKSRGKNAEINVAGHHVHAEHVLSEAEAKEISKKIADYAAANKPVPMKADDVKSRGAQGDCYYYCYYDAYGNYICYWYCY